MDTQSLISDLPLNQWVTLIAIVFGNLGILFGFLKQPTKIKQYKFVSLAKITVIFSLLMLIGLLIFAAFNKPSDWIIEGYYIAGILAPFITLASIFLIVATLVVQQEQLEIQKKEIQKTHEELDKQNKTISLQRFEYTFFQLVEKLNNAYFLTVENESNAKHFKTVLDSLTEEIECLFEKYEKQKGPFISIEKHQQEIVEILYNSCLNVEGKYLNLGLSKIYAYVLLCLKLLKRSERFIIDEEFYFDAIFIELDENVKSLLIYAFIYDDNESVLRYLHKTGYINKLNTIMSPINLTAQRTTWNYIQENAGKLHK